MNFDVTSICNHKNERTKKANHKIKLQIDFRLHAIETRNNTETGDARARIYQLLC